MTRTVLAALILLAATAASAQPSRIESLTFMRGSWVAESRAEQVFESWLGPANGMMVAANLTARRDGRRSFEFLRIAETPQGLVYFASPGGRAPVEFRAVEVVEGRVSFENPRHDFPQRITYWREGANLRAKVEGTMRGAARSEEWTFTPATSTAPQPVGN